VEVSLQHDTLVTSTIKRGEWSPSLSGCLTVGEQPL